VPPGPIRVSMYQEKGGRHHQPHVHVTFADTCEGSFSIDPPELLAGECRSRFSRSVIRWIQDNQDALLGAWAAIQDGKHPSRLEIALG
jgi:hypothetical protein